MYTSRVNPTHVGMDRRSILILISLVGKPHARGDGPAVRISAQSGQSVNPTHVGMDRCRTCGMCTCRGKPHARGDGPSTDLTSFVLVL